MPCQFSLAIEYCVCSVSICRSSLACESPAAPDDASSARIRIASSLPSMTCTSALSSSSSARALSLARSALSRSSEACALARSATRFFSTLSAATSSSRSAIRRLSCSRACSFTLAVMASACSVAFCSCPRSSAMVLSLDRTSGRNVLSSLWAWSKRFCRSSCAFSSSSARRARLRSVSISLSDLAFAAFRAPSSFSSSAIFARSFFMMVRCFCSVLARFLPSSISCAICWSFSASFFSTLSAGAARTAFLADSVASLARNCSLASSASMRST